MSQTRTIRFAKNSAFSAVIIFCAALFFLCDVIKTKIIADYRARELPQIELNAAELHTQIMQHSARDDAGLTYYRDETARAAVVLFYNGVTGNADITEAILTAAERYDIPLSLAFALSYVESGYRPKAVNKNRNSSIDRGLFQLNNKTFPRLSEKDFFNPRTNADLGLSHLRFCLNTAGNEVAALAMYNAGTTRVRNGSTPQVTLNYVANIQSYRAGLETLFTNQIDFIAATQQKQFQNAQKRQETQPRG